MHVSSFPSLVAVSDRGLLMTDGLCEALSWGARALLTTIKRIDQANTMKKTVLSLAIAVLSALPNSSTAEAGKQAKATAVIVDNQGDAVGKASLQQGPRGILLNISVRNMPPGRHGMHFHSKGDCSQLNSFKSAGGHIMPGGLPHGFLNPDGPHAGNLPNLIVREDGTAVVELYTNLLMLDRGEGKVLDADGSSLMIHANEDDHLTQPIGGSGSRIGCGVIHPLPDTNPTL